MNTNNKVKLNSFSPLLGPIKPGPIGKGVIVCGASNIIRTSSQIAMETVSVPYTQCDTHAHSYNLPETLHQ